MTTPSGKVLSVNVGKAREFDYNGRPDHILTIRVSFAFTLAITTSSSGFLRFPQLSASWKRWADDLLRKTKDLRTDSDKPGCC
jgi:hypothetical protein